MDLNANNTFMEQQKWKLYSLVKVSEVSPYDEIQNKNHEADLPKKLFIHPKISATCFVSRK
jgi:hypothetical protein